jgi:hypothetical protein
MKLLSSDLSDSYSTLDALVLAVNVFADSQEYALVKKRIKINKKRIIRKVIFRCDKREDSKSQEFEKRNTSSRSCLCLFEIINTFQTQKWMLRVKTSSHNHSLTLQESHSTLRKLFILTSKIRQQIAIQTETKTSLEQILINLRVNKNKDDSLFKTRDIYNQRQFMR